MRAFLADGCRESFVEVGIACGKYAFVGEFMEEQFGQLPFIIVQEGVQDRIFEPAERREGVHAVNIYLETFLLQLIAATAGGLLRKIAAVGKPADERITPGF